ncbi:MAG TPA: mannosyltransferase family protein, partial [Candidatus Saccharimonadales bacterium]
MSQDPNKIQIAISKFERILNKHDSIFALVVSLALIISGTFIGWYNNKVVPFSTNPIGHITIGNSRLSFLANWDGADYISIATHGYKTVEMSSFFPLYPFLVHVVYIFVGNPLLSALLVSWVALVGAVYFYVKILKQIFTIKTNKTTIVPLLFFLLFPSAIFLIAAYTESLFALFALATIYYALNRKYLLTSLFGLLCTATHLNGVFVVILAAMILCEEKVKLSRIVISLVVGSLGI